MPTPASESADIAIQIAVKLHIEPYNVMEAGRIRHSKIGMAGSSWPKLPLRRGRPKGLTHS